MNDILGGDRRDDEKVSFFLFPLPNGTPFSPVRCLPEVMKASQQAIERGVKDCLFIDYKRRSGHFDVTTVASIKETAEKVLWKR